MNRSSRLSNVFFTFLGAASVGLVVAVLAVAGVFDRPSGRHARSPRAADDAGRRRRRAAAGSVAEIYAQTAPGVAFIEDGGSGGERLGLPDGRPGPRRHQRARRRGREQRSRSASARTATRCRAKLVGKDAVDGPRRARGRPQQDPGRDQAARARLLRRPAPRRRRDRHRQPVRPLRHRDHGHHLRARPRDRRRPTASRSPASCRPTPRSTPATRAARCSTPTAA